jgi:predicted MPP superfamily phosphohydrolase
MWGAIRASGAVVALLIAVYFYFFFRRAIKYFFKDTKKHILHTASALPAVALGALSGDIFSFFAIAVLHFMFFSLLARLIDLVIRKCVKKEDAPLKFWNTVYRGGILALALTFAFSLFGYYKLHNVVATEYTVRTEKSISPDGYRVVLLTDVHYGVSVDDAEFLRICSEISEKDPEIVILCGDIVDNNTTKEQMLFAFKAMGGIKSKYGVFYVHGNHDRPFSFAGFESEFTESGLVNAIESNGIKILQDEVYEISDDLALVGREDMSVKTRRDIDDLIKETDENRFIITLEHQPRDYAKTAQSATDLVLSGHTHGGQLWPLKQVQQIFNMNDKVYGHGFIDSDTQYIVSSGLAGWKYPIKTAAPAEYVVIDITN